MRPPTSVGPGLVPQSRRGSDIAGAACARTTDAPVATANALSDNIVSARFIVRSRTLKVAIGCGARTCALADAMANSGDDARRRLRVVEQGARELTESFVRYSRTQGLQQAWMPS